MTKYCTDIIKIYATAFFDYAKESGLLELSFNEVLKLQEILQTNTTLLEIISAPIYSYKEQMDLIEDITKSLSLSKELLNLLGILAENRRLYALSDILEKFNILLIEHSGNKIVEATINHEMYKEDQIIFKENLEKQLSLKIELSYKIDPSILGGVIIKMDNRMLDASLKTKFSNLISNIEREIALL